ncbi:Dbl homology domain-containing protein, partial [Mycena epipterygia]
MMEPAPPVPPPRSPLRPPPPPPPANEPALSKRQHALHELLSSERAYASDLALILEVHIPMALGPMTAEDIKTIFGNIADLAELSDAFCEALEQTMGSALDSADATDDRVGELFLRFAPELEAPYKQYITRHPSALAHLTALPTTPELTAYHVKTRDAAASLSHAWDLSSLLIKPVQRLLKYSLLLAAIIDATALSHPDRPHLLSARAAMEEVARAVNEGRRRAEVVKEVLSAPKKPPTVLRLKSFRAPADVNSEAARVDRMAAELARIDVFAQQLSRSAQEWARAADTSAHALLSWARSFAAAIGLTATVRSEAFDAFLQTLTSSLLPRSAALLPQIASDLLAPLARLLASAAQPRQLLASMTEHAPLHHHLLTMPVSAKNRPPPALLSASAHYLALRVQLAAELPAYLSLLHRGLAALVRRLAAVQAAFFGDARDAWAGLWDMLRVEGERNGGGAETEAVWRARWADVDLGVQTLAVCHP